MKTLSMKFYIACTLVFVFACASPAGTVDAAEGGEHASGNIIALKEVLAETSGRHPEIREALSNYRSVLAERSIAASGYWPTVGTEIAGGPESTKGPGTDDRQEDLTAFSATLYARQNLYAGGGTDAFVKETDARVQAAAYEVLTVANQVFLETAEAYIQVLQARELLAYAGENANAQESILAQVREKTESGFNRVSDLYNAESRLALSRANYISKQQDLNQAIVRFHRQFGRFVKPVSFKAPLPSFSLPGTVEKTVAIALDTHPALKVAEFNIQVRRHSHQRARAAYWPTLDLELQGRHSSDSGGTKGETDAAAAQLKLNYTLLDGGRRKGEVGRNYGFVKKEYERSYIERRNVNQAVRLAWNIYQAEQHKQKFLQEHIALSAQTLDAFKEEYFVGRRTLLDLLNMENEYHSARDAGALSTYALLTAYYRLCQATGILLHEYDTGLRKLLALSPNSDFTLQEYDGLGRNVDLDAVEDRRDQCDNSAGGDLAPNGCSISDAVTYGYQAPDRPAPYIVPEEELLPETEFPAEDRPEPGEQSFQLDTIHFDSDSADIADASLSILEGVAARLKSQPDYHIEVIGHTDNTGSVEHNRLLSRERARSVVDALVDMGIDADRFSFAGRGESFPIDSNATEAGKSRNRRIEFRLTRSQGEGADEPASSSVDTGRPEQDLAADDLFTIDTTLPEQSFHVQAIHFASDATRLTEDSELLLERVAHQFKKLDGFTVEIIGHTDSTGSEGYNQALSLARAESVYTSLVQFGLLQRELTFSGMGERDPIATNETEAGKRKNRRIQFKLTQKQSF